MKAIPTPEQVGIMKLYAASIKRARELVETMRSENMQPDVLQSTFMFAAVISRYEYEAANNPDRILNGMRPLPVDYFGQTELTMACGHHLSQIIPLLGMSLGMVKDTAQLEDLIAGLTPEEMEAKRGQ